MKKHLTNILIVLIAITGLSFLLYPTVSDYLNSRTYRRTITDYVRTVSQLDNEEYKEVLNAAREYNEALGEEGFVPFNMPEERLERYLTLLDVTGTGIMGYIEIPSVNIYLPIYHGSDEAVLQNGVGHLEWSSLPVGGESSHSVLSGHTGLPSSKLFTDIDQLAERDIFTIRVLNETFTYEVDRILTVLPAEVSSLRIEKGMDYCTLITCTPYGINSHRLLVRGHRIETPEDTPDAEEQIAILSEAEIIDSIKIVLIVAVPVLILIGIILIARRRKRK